MIYVSINRNVLFSNKKWGKNEPAIGVRRGRTVKAEYFHQVNLPDGGRIVQDEENPLPCGARVWVETAGRVEGVKL